LKNYTLKRSIKKIVIIVFCGFLFVCGCEEFMRRVIGEFAGSYPYAESWEINAKESDVITAIKEFERDSGSHQQKSSVELESIAKRDTEYDWGDSVMLAYQRKLAKDSLTPLPKYNSENSHLSYWLFVDFYYSDTKQVVHAWTRPDIDSMKTTLAFVSISGPDDFHENKLINKDFWYFENKRQIHKFERLIVNQINSKILKLTGIKRAENGIRTRGLQFGKLMLYRLSYFR
jgi:hypothetical protein